MTRIASDLAKIELDSEPGAEDLAIIIDTMNRDRADRGLPPLHDDEPPEEELYRRARAIGLRPSRG